MYAQMCVYDCVFIFTRKYLSISIRVFCQCTFIHIFSFLPTSFNWRPHEQIFMYKIHI